MTWPPSFLSLCQQHEWKRTAQHHNSFSFLFLWQLGNSSSGWTWAVAAAAGLVKISGRPFLFCQFLFFLSRLQTKLVALSSSSLSFLFSLVRLEQ